MKKLIAIIILTFMISTLLVGCKKNKGNPPVKTPADQSQSAGDQTQTPDDNKQEESNGGSTGNNNSGTDFIPDDDEIIEDVIPDTDDENTEIGTTTGYKFNDVVLEKVGGGTVSTADYRGKVIILNLWATWCSPCKAELPDFSRIATEYGDDVVVIAAHVPSGRENAPSYIQTNLPQSDIIFAYDTYSYDAFLAAGGVESIPQTVVIDRDGIIFYSGAGMLSYEILVEIIEFIL